MKTTNHVSNAASEACVSADDTARNPSMVVSHDRLSLNAKNVRIADRHREATLRGPVASAEGKRIIADSAARHASGRIVNQIDTAGRQASRPR